MSRLLDFDAAAEYLGLSSRYLRRLVSERRIAVLRDRRRLFFTPEDLDSYVDGLERVERRQAAARPAAGRLRAVGRG
jgi:excisionase family DNA binding protein